MTGLEPHRAPGLAAVRRNRLEALLRDVRLAARSLRRAPAFSLTALFTLALGIGASTAIFGLAWAIRLKPLPYEHAEQLVNLYDIYRGSGGGYLSAPELEDYKRETRSFSGMSGYLYGAGFTTLDGEVKRIRVRCRPICFRCWARARPWAAASRRPMSTAPTAPC